MKKILIIVMIFIIAGASTGSILKAESLQGHPFGLEMHPQPGAVNVPLDTSISLFYGRAGFNATAKLDTKPEVEIGNVTTDREPAPTFGARFTFYPAKPLRPNTKYNVTVTLLRNGYPGIPFSWQFTTETAKTPRAVPGFGIAMTVMAIFLGISRKYLGKRQDGFASGVNSSNGRILFSVR